MNKQDLKLILENPALSKLLLDVLSKDSSSVNIQGNSTLDNFLEEDNFNKPHVPAVTDLRDKGHRAASNFANEYFFPVGGKFVVWFTGHDSSLRQALERNGLKTSFNTLSKGKKYEIKILSQGPAKKKSA